jgi:hypothetical protein
MSPRFKGSGRRGPLVVLDVTGPAKPDDIQELGIVLVMSLWLASLPAV